MITRYNFTEVINSLSEKEKKRIINTDKEYVLITAHIFNVGAYYTAQCTNRYRNTEHPVYLFDSTEVVNILQSQMKAD